MAKDVKRLELLTMLYDGEFSDFTIVVENVEFPSHKIILATRSAYFRALFSSKMSECQTNRLTLDDVEVDVFKKLLKYVYTFELELDNDCALKLILLGEQYGLEDLVDLCEDHLVARMNPRIASQCLLVGDLLGRKKLKEKASSWSAANWKKIFSTDGWNDVATNHSLMTEIETIECTKEQPPTIIPLSSRCGGAIRWSIQVDEWMKAESSPFSLLEDDQSLWKLSMSTKFDKYRQGLKYIFQEDYRVYLSHIGPPLATPVGCHFYMEISASGTSDVFTGTIDTSCCFSPTFTCSTLLGTTKIDYSKKPLLDIKLTSFINHEPSPTGFSDHLNKARFTDAVVNIAGETFPCHKIILSTASPFFSEAFQDQNELQLNQVNPETFRILLLIIYQSREIPEELHFDLLTAANQFKLDDKLLNRCRSLVFRKMLKDNQLTEFLIRSHYQQDPIQKMMAFKQIANKFKEGVKCKDWIRMRGHAELHDEFFKYLIANRPRFN